MTPSSYVKERQKLWALRQRRPFDLHGCCATSNENLLEPLSDNAIRQFNAADGGELSPRGNAPPKMHSLHSSSALAVNVFHFWSHRDQTPLAKALGIPSQRIQSVDFEKLSPIAPDIDRKKFPKDPNIDVVINYESGPFREVGIESKFSEAYGQHAGLKDAYLQEESLWEGIPNCRQFAERLREPAKVHGLNTPQLLKHLLGLKHRAGIGNFWLVYLWYATPGSELGEHFTQLEEFKEILAQDGIRFHFRTYQEVICNLAGTVRSDHQGYVDYLVERYL